MRTLTEKEAENFLEKNNFKIAKREFAKNASSLEKIKIQFPWAMKASGKEINHKKSIGAVFLNINSIEEAEKIFEKLKKISGCEEILIQEMIKGEEFIIGLKKTPEFGNVIMLGKGGSNVEKEKDISFRIPPIKEKEAKEMIEELKVYKNIKENINKTEILKNLINMSELAKKNPNINELDINPLIANNNEAIVVDARISLE